MISCAEFERSGWWRWVAVVLVFAIVLAPAIPLVAASLEAADSVGSDAGFSAALERSFIAASCVMVTSLVLGFPCGILAGLYHFPLRRLLLGALVLPLLAPPFLWAIGLSMLRLQLGWGPDSLLSGRSGMVLAFAASTVPLVLFGSLLATRSIARNQIQAARLAGGEWQLILLVSRNVFPVAALVAILGGLLTLSDTGPGQIFRYEGAASQILATFSAEFNFPLAARQSLLLAALVLCISLPASWILAPRLATGLLSRAVSPAALEHSRKYGLLALGLLGLVIMVTLGLPLFGLVEPAISHPRFGRAWNEVSRTLGDTVIYALGTGFLALLLGTVLAIFTGRQTRMRMVVLSGLMVVFSLPPALGALGLVLAGSDAPAAFDGILRSRFTVVLWLASRLFPVVAIFVLRSLGNSSQGWALAAAVHGISPLRYLLRVLIPWLAPAALVSGALVSLLALADISSMLLLHPPGADSLPLAIFTVMANAPESIVASMCLLYFAGAAVIVAMIWMAVSRCASMDERRSR